MTGFASTFGAAISAYWPSKSSRPGRLNFTEKRAFANAISGSFFSSIWGDEDVGEGLSRTAILSFIGGRWHAGVCRLKGEGRAADLLWLSSFERHQDTADAFWRTR